MSNDGGIGHVNCCVQQGHHDFGDFCCKNYIAYVVLIFILVPVCNFAFLIVKIHMKSKTVFLFLLNGPKYLRLILPTQIVVQSDALWNEMIK